MDRIVGTGGAGVVPRPAVRRPDITLARAPGWSPPVPMDDGLERTIAWFRSVQGDDDDRRGLRAARTVAEVLT